MHNHSAEEIKSACDKAGGAFSQDAGGYGCSSDCHGGHSGPHGADCVVACKTDKSCAGQVPGRKGPTVSPLNVLKGSARSAR
jgi:hypothetical protein